MRGCIKVGSIEHEEKFLLYITQLLIDRGARYCNIKCTKTLRRVPFAAARPSVPRFHSSHLRGFFSVFFFHRVKSIFFLDAIALSPFYTFKIHLCKEERLARDTAVPYEIYDHVRRKCVCVCTRDRFIPCHSTFTNLTSLINVSLIFI